MGSLASESGDDIVRDLGWGWELVFGPIGKWLRFRPSASARLTERGWRDQMRAAWPNVLDEGDFEDWSVCTSRSPGRSPGMVWPDCPTGVTVVYAFVFRDMRYKTADYVVAAANVSPSIEATTGPHRHPASGELVVTANDDILMVWRRDANVRGEVEGLVDELLAEASRRNTRVVETEPRLPVVP